MMMLAQLYKINHNIAAAYLKNQPYKDIQDMPDNVYPTCDHILFLYQSSTSPNTKHNDIYIAITNPVPSYLLNQRVKSNCLYRQHRTIATCR